MATLNKSVAEAIVAIKRSAYKGTAIKVELEAQLGRSQYGDDYTETCDYCDGDGYQYCETCNHTGEVEETTCDDCWGDGRLDCSECEGRGEISQETEGWSDDRCKEYLLDNVSKEARDALIYGQFYDDGSVDSEFTFTVPIDKPHVVLEYITAFKQLADEIGNEFDVEGAGMHIAILNSARGTYPDGNHLDRRRANNFAQAMTSFLPALYFLSTPDHRSRRLNYRMPQISLRDKYSAITGHRGVFEYRLFETCYDRPEAFLDFFCVIANTLKFYRLRPLKVPFFGKIGDLGICEGYGVERFYFSVKHIDALEAGVAVLKPAYKTFAQLKKERNFKIDKTSLRKSESKRVAQFRAEWPEFKQRIADTKKRATKEATEEWNRRLGNDSYYIATFGTRERYIAAVVEDRIGSSPTSLQAYIASRQNRYRNIITTITV